MKSTNTIYSITFALIYTSCVLLLLFWLYKYDYIEIKRSFTFLHIAVIAIILFFFSLLIERLFFNKLYKVHIQSLSNKISENIPLGNIKQIEENISDYTKKQELELVVLEDREKYRREFLGNVSHELKTPLFSIQGFVLTLIEGGVEDLKIRDKYLDRINKSVDRLIYIVKDLDTINQLESGVMSLSIKSFNIVALAQEVFDLMEIKAMHNHVTLNFNKKYLYPIYVMGDIDKIRQILINLVSNAISHSNSKDCIVTISFVLQNEKLEISVSDTGQGINKEHLSRLFERFYRIDSARNRKQGGSGLGLSIVKHILEAHGEKIKVKTEVGKGTSFIFHLKKA